MNTSKLPEIFRERDRISDEEYALVLELRRRYPYFQAAHILVAKASRDRGDLDAPGFLKSASLHAGDRKALYDYLISPSVRRHISSFEQELSSTELSVEPAPEAASGFTQKENAPDAAPEMPETVENTEISQVGQTAEVTAMETVEKPTSLLPEPPAAVGVSTSESTEIESDTPVNGNAGEPVAAIPARDESLAEMEKEILYEAIYSSIEKEVQEDMAASAVQHNPEKHPAKSENESPALQAHTPFTAWLLKRAAETSFLPSQSGGESAGEEADTREKARKLIDDFIQKDPRITPAKADVFSSENLGRMSLAEDEEFVTETLAKIYVKQGKADKAIKAYKLLMLKFPEKSIYFANQLKKLEENRK